MHKADKDFVIGLWALIAVVVVLCAGSIAHSIDWEFMTAVGTFLGVLLGAYAWSQLS